jgi:hypothetical protein
MSHVALLGDEAEGVLCLVAHDAQDLSELVGLLDLGLLLLIGRDWTHGVARGASEENKGSLVDLTVDVLLLLKQNLRKNASCSPEVDPIVIVAFHEDDLRSSVPSGGHMDGHLPGFLLPLLLGLSQNIVPLFSGSVFDVPESLNGVGHHLSGHAEVAQLDI